MEPSRLVFRDVRVADAPPAEFCLDPPAKDPVAAWLLEHDRIDEPVMRAFLCLVGRGSRVVDLGCHLGTFSLPAAALGAEVLAVDGSARQVHLLRTAARRNRFTSLEVVHGVISDSDELVPFVENSIHGRIWAPRDSLAATAQVPPVSVDDLVERRGWDGVEVIKMDIEGSEPAALRGMARLLERGVRPAIVFECNGDWLPWFGSSIDELRGTLGSLGYELLLIDHLRPGRLVEMNSDSVQTECACDYVALTSRPDRLTSEWVIEPPFSREQTLTRLIDTASSSERGIRRYAAEILVSGPPWLRSEPMAITTRRAIVVDGRIVETGARGSASATQRDDAPSDSLVLAEGLDVAPATDAERPGPGRHVLARLLVRGVSFFVRPGQSLALLAEEPDAASALLRVLAGVRKPVAGSLRVRGRPVLVSTIEDVFEPELSLGENILLFAAYVGCDLRAADSGLENAADRAGVGHLLDTPLGEATPEIQTRLALAVATELAEPELLLIDRLPAITDPVFSRWFAERAAQLTQEGTALIQVVGANDQPMAAADRMLWIDDTGAGAYGHPELVLEARRTAGHAGSLTLTLR